MRSLATMLTSVFVLLVLSLSALSQIEVVPGSSRRGEELFAAKGCTGCHGIDGRGASLAPDLGRRAANLYSPDLLASVMWNHGPRMWEAIRETGQSIPTLSSSESADLFSHFYSRLYFSVPGDAARGRRAFADRNCIVCHALDREADTGQIGPPLSDWARVRDPIIWAERMWNHASQMYRQMDDASIRWPQLTDQDLADLLAYFQDLPSTRSELAAFEPGEPELGLVAFTSNCEGCHSFGESLPGRVDLLRRPGPASLMGYAAAMWNHAPRMDASTGNALPVLDDGEMNHLVSYLFAQRYFADSGSIESGALVYREKGCVTCHELERLPMNAPDLTQSTEVHSAITMTQALWSHGPEMLLVMEERDMEWPTFEGREMADLIAYLNSRLVRRIAEGR